mgnify:CR=1 FL=1
MGNYNAQQSLANLKYPEQYGIVVGTFPYDKQMDWTIREFGPLPIPQKWSDSKDEPYELSFIQAIDRVGTEEEITYKGWTDSIG